MRRGTPRRSEQNQSLDEEIGKIPEQLRVMTIMSNREWSHLPTTRGSGRHETSLLITSNTLLLSI
jgi:hypothetical protein